MKAEDSMVIASLVQFVFPMPPTLTNSARGRSRHWWSAEKEKKAYWELLDTLQNIGRVPPPPEKAWAVVGVQSTMYLGGGMDDDNAMARHKWAFDWLKTRGYLVDDRKKNIKWADFPEQIVKRGQEYRIELTLSIPPHR